MKSESSPLTTANSSLVTKNASTMTPPQLFASLWNSRPAAIFWKWLKVTSRPKLSFQKAKFGKPWYTSLKVWDRCTIKKFCTEIWNALTSLSQATESINWEIWMFQKSSKKTWPEPKLEPHTMLRHRFGRTSHTAWKVTCGRWAACFMKWPHSSHHLLPQICQACTKKFVQGIFQRFQQATQMICQKWSLHSWNKTLVKGPIPLSFFKTQPFTKCTQEQLMSNQRSWKTTTFCWKRSKSTMATFPRSKTYYPRQIMTASSNQAAVEPTQSKESKPKRPNKSKSQLKPLKSKDPNLRPQSRKRRKNNKKWLTITWRWKGDMKKRKDRD